MKLRKYSEGAPRLIKPVIASKIATDREALTFRLARLVRKTETGCVEFLGAKNRDGYAKINFRHEGRHLQFYAHRVFYTLATGREIPRDKVLDHKCRNRCCVNPAHMQVVSVRTNALRAVAARVKKG